jgi:hypothetical protein
MVFGDLQLVSGEVKAFRSPLKKQLRDGLSGFARRELGLNPGA